MTLTGAVVIASSPTEGLLGIVLGIVIGVPLLVLGIMALVKKPDRTEPAFIISGAPPVSTNNDDPVQIAAGDEVEAAYVLLKSDGIPAFRKSSAPDPQYPNWTDPGEAGDLLMVPRSSLKEARELLDSRVSEKDLIAQAEAAAPLNPPRTNRS